MNKQENISLGSVDQVSLGYGRCFTVKGIEIAVFRPRDGGIMAIENRCPHQQGSLADGVIGAGKVICPLHGHKFNLATGEGDAVGECVQTFRVWEENGEILIGHEVGVL